ncbi:MAG TPA: glutamate racemase, partial [Kiloniellaceae bacterium]
VMLLDQPAIVADSLADYLARHRRFATAPGGGGRRRFLTSGDAVRVSAFASSFIGAEIGFERA